MVYLLFWFGVLFSFNLEVIGRGKITNCTCGQSNILGLEDHMSWRIGGGEEAMLHEYPFMVSIELLKAVKDVLPPIYLWDHICGGSIITVSHILTAAHCTNLSPIRLVVGDHDKNTQTGFKQVIEIAHIDQHPNFLRPRSGHDIAVITTKTPIPLNDAIGRICLPSTEQNLVGETVQAIGWGNSNVGVKQPVLMKVALEVVPISKCSEACGKHKYFCYINATNPIQLCTHSPNKFTFKGDSGGPLVWFDKDTISYVQVALVSFGSDVPNEHPTVNTDVFSFLPWIQETITKSAHLTGILDQTCSVIA